MSGPTPPRAPRSPPLSLRADAQRREALRTQDNARYQEGRVGSLVADGPLGPGASAELEPGRTITDGIAERDLLRLSALDTRIQQRDGEVDLVD